MTTTLRLGIAALALLTSASASAADLVNRGGTSDVPTYDGRVYYIKPSGASCPSGFTCFCNSGSSCQLPASPSIITGTVIIDREGVTLDCQNRIIQPPRFGSSSRQHCTNSADCGTHSSGAPHACVNDYCQLNNLGGINVGGPLSVDDGAININVNATGYVQDVQIRNCKVRNHYAGYVHQAYEGDDGRDEIDILTSELRGNYIGSYVYATDDTYAFGNYVHDNIQTGMDFHYNWSLEVAGNSVLGNGNGQMYFHGDADHTNRWFNIYGNDIESYAFPAVYGANAGNVVISDLEGTFTSCGGENDSCDMRFEGNWISAHDNEPEIDLYNSRSWSPSTMLRFNRMAQYDSWVDVRKNDSFANDPICWQKENVCYTGSSSQARGCRAWPSSSVFTSSHCWY